LLQFGRLAIPHKKRDIAEKILAEVTLLTSVAKDADDPKQWSVLNGLLSLREALGEDVASERGKIEEKITAWASKAERDRIAKAIEAQDLSELLATTGGSGVDPLPYLRVAERILLEKAAAESVQKQENDTYFRLLMARYLQLGAVDDAIRFMEIMPDASRRNAAVGAIRESRVVLSAAQRQRVLPVVSRLIDSDSTDNRVLLYAATYLRWAGDDRGARIILQKIKPGIELRGRSQAHPVDDRFEDERRMLLSVAELQKDCGDSQGATSTLERFCDLYDGNNREVLTGGWGVERNLDELEKASRLLISLGQTPKAWRALRRPMESFIRRPFRLVRTPRVMGEDEGVQERTYISEKLLADEVVCDHTPILLRYGAGVQARNGDLDGAAYTARHITMPGYRATALAEVIDNYIGRNSASRRKPSVVGTRQFMTGTTTAPASRDWLSRK
jgi:hypothetical protein